jgi:hypothetical protein
MLEQGNWDQMDQMEHGRCPMAPSTWDRGGGALTLVFSYSQSNFHKFPIFQQKQMNHGILF